MNQSGKACVFSDRIRRRRGQRHGQSLIEVIVGSFMLIPIALFGVDMTAIVLANTANDNLAKSAARAAANQDSREKAQAAARSCIGEFQKSAMIVDVQLSDGLSYQKDKSVVVKTRMTVKLPAAFQGFDLIKFEAQAVEPVLALPADV